MLVAHDRLTEGDALGIVPGEESVTDVLLFALLQSGVDCRVVRLSKVRRGESRS